MMTKKKAKLSILAGLFASVLCTFHTPAAHAQTGGAGNLTASPAEIQLEVAQRQPQQSKQITLTNNYDSTITVSAELRAIDETSGLFVPEGQLEDAVSRSLSISETDFQIQPHSNKIITLSANNQNALGPGGHYATLLLTQRSTDSQQLSLRSAISVNVFFIKADGAKQSIKLDHIQAKSWILHIASQAEVKFTNNGNVRSTPHGVVYVTNQHDTLISKGIANSGSQPLLQGKSVTNTVDLVRIQRVWYPQKLYFNVSYRADDLDPITQTYSFWYMPPFYLLLPFVLAGAIFWSFKKYKKPSKRVKKSASKTKSDMPKILKIAIRLHDDEPSKIQVKKKP